MNTLSDLDPVKIGNTCVKEIIVKLNPTKRVYSREKLNSVRKCLCSITNKSLKLFLSVVAIKNMNSVIYRIAI